MSTLSAGPAAHSQTLTPFGLFVFGTALAAVWLVINFLLPELGPTGIPSTVVRLVIHGTILTGLWLGLARTDFSLNKRVAIWSAVAVYLTVWLAFIWYNAVNGAFVPGASRVPRLPIAIFVPIIVWTIVLVRLKAIGTLLDAMPATWLVGLQVYRIFGGIFLVVWANGGAAGEFAWPAAIGDMMTGIMALPTALLLASREQGRRAAIAWNIFGILDLVVAVTTGFLSSPGPWQMFGFHLSAPQLGIYPTVMIPAFAVPSSILLHVLSLRQLRRLEAKTAPRA